ncbi:MAG: SUMF1/EgtB/PvdO family nonheme iron enzyme [Kiritimatiellae bacterium]|nr:SUMF1/EgtB/PvdO family nonheme iron enzyme [Kiritimatiellia bacterium]
MKRLVLLLPLLSLAALSSGCRTTSRAPAERAAPVEAPSEPPRTLELADGVRMRMLPVPAGTFRMGSPRSERGRTPEAEDPVTVALSRPFWLAETETTQAAWAAIMDGETVVDLARKFLREDPLMDGRPIREAFGFPRGIAPIEIAGPRAPDHPVVWVSWTDAAEFCRRVDARERAAGRVPDGYEYRLPTEAEWERACRAGEDAPLPNGRSPGYVARLVHPELDDIAWYCGNCSTNPLPRRANPLLHGWGRAVNTRPVGTKAPNAWGFRDMIGNVFEWCADACDTRDYRLPGGTDPVRLAPAGIRANRGGSWAVGPRTFLRSAARSFCPEEIRSNDLGFRLALAPTLPAAEEPHVEAAGPEPHAKPAE